MLAKTSATDAKAMNTVGEGEAAATFRVADPKGEWFATVTEFPLIDTESGTRFEGRVPTRATRTSWVQSQLDARAMTEVEQPAEAKGKAATTVDPSIDESPKSDDTHMGNGMQTGVAGS